MNARESLAVTAAGLRKFRYLWFLDAIPTPPMVPLYAEPWPRMSPTPNMEYGV